jgi:hypothetical protein
VHVAEAVGRAACHDPRAGRAAEAAPDRKRGRKGGPLACHDPRAGQVAGAGPDLKRGRKGGLAA